MVVVEKGKGSGEVKGSNKVGMIWSVYGFSVV